jgi:oligoendopeptidase F
MHTRDDATAPARRFIPDALEVTDTEWLARVYRRLHDRPVPDAEELERLILDRDELEGVVQEAKARAYVAMTADTANEEAAGRYRTIVQEVLPLVEREDFRLKRKILDADPVHDLGPEWSVLLRELRADVALYREENVALHAEEAELAQRYEQISGAQEAEFRGERMPLPRLYAFLEETDRPTREEAWRARSEVLLEDAGALDALFDEMFAVRVRIAENAGYPDYRAYRFAELKRFDYGPEETLALHDAIERHVVPWVVADQERSREMLGLETLRPWDLAVDPAGRPPLRPFADAGELADGAARTFRHLDDELGGFFDAMRRRQLLDLESRARKAPTGYMVTLADIKAPFIFMNAVGTARDVRTLLHEGGHAFNYFLGRAQPVHAYRFPKIEFAEVGSMAMELLALPHLGAFYEGDELDRVREDQLRAALRLLPSLAMTDAFQHWVYTTDPVPDAEARRMKWAELEERFRPGIDWSDIRRYRDIGWQFFHIFNHPFYVIEYAIAQIASLGIWLNALEDEAAAVHAYKEALALGGSRPLPEIFEAAGVPFRFDEEAVREVVEGVAGKMER